MAVHRDHLTLHLERLQQAYGSELTLPVQRAAPAAPARQPAAQVGQPAAASPATAPRPASSRKSPPVAAANPTSAPAPTADPSPATADPLAALKTRALSCEQCKLCEHRTNVVFGEGAIGAPVMFVGEAPGANEDRTGRPFVGAAGQLLDKIIANAMGFGRDEVYIANINKCRPPNNREPQPDEVAACLPYLQEQVELVRPQAIVCLGRIAAQNLLGRKESATRLRGQELDYRGVPVVVTWHPAYLLREPSRKRETWEDIKRVNRILGRPEVPPK